ncbi:MAG: sugar ABC transporter ATP-binding protein [Lachnospiraceae bacterium]|nr:sugar ABC transporter ATP-binding protein [Lachnospiraceae bacterium]
MQESEYRVELRDIYKSFAGVKALNGAQLSVKPGEVHALIGENGAGKSTLIRCLSGVHLADSGKIFMDGEEVHISTPKQGIDMGISVIYQEFALMQDLSVAENVLIDQLRSRKTVKWRQLRREARSILDQLGFEEINVNAPVKTLPVAMQQVVEICKALSRNCKILVLDEPTAVLTNKEVERLFVLINMLREKGVSIIYISHRLEEIFRICDRITVMKDGAYVKTVNTDEITQQDLVNLMIGRTLDTYFPKRSPHVTDEVIFEVRNLKAGIDVKDVSFAVRRGEVLGLSGLVGAGRTESIRALIGTDKLEEGEAFLNGKPVRFHSPKAAFEAGVGYLPEDRKNQGVLLNLPIYQNITMSALQKNYTGTLGFVKRGKENQDVRNLAEEVTLKAASLKNPVSSLSGGNQQKVAVARLLATNSEVLILDEPTRGVDVGAKTEIFRLINSMVEKGCAVIMISSEMAEIIGMCDRAVIFREGRTVAELQKEELTEENIIAAEMGVENEQKI